jgi:2-dehydro-3-deoxygluconokinase
MTLRVFCIGECMIELRPAGDEDYRLSFAGDVYNAAVYLKRSAPEIDVQFVSATGDDPLSARMRRVWANHGVGDRLCPTLGHDPPGLYLIDLTPEGERSFVYWRAASPARRWLDLLLSAGGVAPLAGADLVLLSGISLAILPESARTQALELLAALRGQVGRIAFDPNYRPRLWGDPEIAASVMRHAIGLSDIVLPSIDDIRALDLDLSRCSEAVVTSGAGGCCVMLGVVSTDLPATPPAAAVVDTSGAGDSFTGAYLAARLTGTAPLAAARKALDLAAQVVTVRGAIMP